MSVATPIAELAEDRVVEGVFAVARKQQLRTRSGNPYLALELVDPSGRIEARVWSDVELLEGRFDEGDAVRVLGRVERFRDRLQLDVRTVERAAGTDPATLVPESGWHFLHLFYRDGTDRFAGAFLTSFRHIETFFQEMAADLA